MNSSIVSTDVSAVLLAVPYQLNRCLGLFLWIFGNLGCLGNIIVFRSDAFRHRAYSIYLFSEGISNLIYFNFVLVTRVLQKGFQIPLTNRYDSLCKLRQFWSFWGNQISFTSFIFATIDRLLSTKRSNTYRKWSNRVGLASKVIFLNMFLWFLFIGHRLIFYDVANGSCDGPEGFYSIWDEWFEVFTSAVCPPFVMIILAFLLIRSVRDVIQRRNVPLNNHMLTLNARRRTLLQQMDSKLSLMLLLQCIIVIITYVPYASELAYSSITKDYFKTSQRIAQEKVFTELTHLLSYVFFASSFYVSFISNNGFRRQMKRSLRIASNNVESIHVMTLVRFQPTTHLQENQH